MQAIYEFLQRIGLQSLDAFWFPMLIWTVVALIIFLSFRLFDRLNPLYHYHLRAATLAAIPFGLLSTLGVHYLNTLATVSNGFDPALFVVETPQTLYLASTELTTDFSPNWFEPSFLIGAATLLLVLISLGMLFRLAGSYISLKRLHASLSKVDLSSISEFNSSNYRNIKLSFHEHPMVPFTFGWKNPIIVLPTSIQDDPEKVRMAIQHELVHIQRGDYLLQLFLSVIESIFWFHPLIRFGSREIETYREISCDQQVLSTSGISLKNYASMLYELLPLNRGLGSFSVSMAVQKSTLEKRIETMKYHKLHKTSLKRSLLFLLLMIIAVTVPIACSDMRGPEGLSPEEIQNEKITFQGLLVKINDMEELNIDMESGVKSISTYGLGSISFQPGKFGTFVISLRNFEDAQLAGTISGNKATFEINELNVEMISNSKILENNDEAELWVKHFPSLKSPNIFRAFMNAEMDYSSIFETQQKSFEENGDYFVVVEEMPKLIGGLASIQGKVQYPEMAKRAGIQGRVTVQFIVNENGDVENPKVIRGIGGGCDEAALAAVSEAKFEPGKQRGRSVRVQYSLPIVFRLSDSDFTSSNQTQTTSPNLNTPSGELGEQRNEIPSDKDIVATLLSYSNDSIKLRITNMKQEPLPGANVLVSGTTIGAAADQRGNVTLTGIDSGRQELTISFLGLNTEKFYHTFKEEQ